MTTSAPIAVPDQFATVRTNPITGAIDYLGVVGSKYEPVQNEASCTLLDALTDESGAHFETAGALRGGRETFVMMKLPTSMTVEGRDGSKDPRNGIWAALNSHDGSSAFLFLLTSMSEITVYTKPATCNATFRAVDNAGIAYILTFAVTRRLPRRPVRSRSICGDRAELRQRP